MNYVEHNNCVEQLYNESIFHLSKKELCTIKYYRHYIKVPFGSIKIFFRSEKSKEIVKSFPSPKLRGERSVEVWRHFRNTIQLLFARENSEMEYFRVGKSTVKRFPWDRQKNRLFESDSNSGSRMDYEGHYF